MPTIYRTLENADLKGKKVLMRVDHNVDIDPEGKLKTDSKIRASLPAIQYVLDQGAKLILMCHVGRPKGKVDPRYSTDKVSAHLQTLLPKVKITHIKETVGPNVEKAIEELKTGNILYLENVRFSPDEEGEQEQQDAFGAKLAALAEVYVNEAFPSCHTYEEASTCAVARLLPAYAGPHLMKEVQHLSPIFDDPARPLVLLISGSKMETKIPVIEGFLSQGDDILLGGCIANTFLAARGFNVAKSKYEEDFVAKAQEEMLEAEKSDKANVHLPVDTVLASAADNNAESVTKPVENIDEEMMILDLGSETVERYKRVIDKAGMIIWNGPVGFYEAEKFSHGTAKLAEIIAEATKNGATSIIGGGDTIDFHSRYGMPLSAYSFVSTAGGAMLEFLSGEKFPSLRALEKQEQPARN